MGGVALSVCLVDVYLFLLYAYYDSFFRNKINEPSTHPPELTSRHSGWLIDYLRAYLFLLLYFVSTQP